MKVCFLNIFLVSTFISSAQFDRSISIRATANLDYTIKGMSTNDAAYGLGFDAAFFAKHKFMAVIETSAEKFIGDKSLRIDTITSEELTNASILGIKAGPQFFLAKQLALSVTCGPTWHVLNESNYTLDIGFKYCLTGFLGDKRKFIMKFFLVNIPANPQINYVGFGMGCRF